MKLLQNDDNGGLCPLVWQQIVFLRGEMRQEPARKDWYGKAHHKEAQKHKRLRLKSSGIFALES